MTFWTDKRVCVTGGAGLVGTELVRLLLNDGAYVVVVDNLSRGKTLIKSDRVEYYASNAGELVAQRMRFLGVDAVFNLAAYVAGVTYNQSHHAEMFERNMKLLTTPVIAAKEVGVSRFLQVSSVCVYAEDKQNPCIESEIGGDPNPSNAGYAWAKRMGERIALWADLPHCVIVRPANIYGVNDYFDERSHVIPALINKCMNDDVIRVNGTGQEVREFLYTTDAARGMMVALEKGQRNQVYNIGTDGENSCTISELAYTIRDILGEKKQIEFIGDNGGDNRRIVNGDKLMRLGWNAEVNLITGLRKVCEWRQNAAH